MRNKHRKHSEKYQIRSSTKIARKEHAIVVVQSAAALVLSIVLVTRLLYSFASHAAALFHEHPHFPVPPTANITFILLGLLLAYCSLYLLQRKHTAYVTVIVLLCITSLGLIIARQHTTPVVLLCIGLIVWLLFTGKYYGVRSGTVRFLNGLGASSIVAALSLLYGTFNFLLLGPSSFHRHFELGSAFIASFRTLFTLTDGATAITRKGTILLDSLNAAGLLTYLLILGSLFKPVRFALGSSQRDRKEARHILEIASSSSEDYFKLWPSDKHYFFSKTRHSFIAYKLSGKTVLILRDPSGNEHEYLDLLKEFRNFVHLNGWLVAVIGPSPQLEWLYDDLNFQKLHIGNDAVVTIGQFVSDTIRSKHFRYVANRAKALGLTAEFWEHPSHEQVSSLAHISDEWKSYKGRREYTFFMGYFHPIYLMECQIMVLRQGASTIGYVNLVPTFSSDTASIDQFRSIQDAPGVGMHYLFSQLILHLHAKNIRTLNIGLSPLAPLKDPATSKWNEPLLELLKTLMNQYYSFRGVEQFKSKFRPHWTPMNIYFEGSPIRIAQVGRDLERASRTEPYISTKKKTILWLVGVAAVVTLIQFM